MIELFERHTNINNVENSIMLNTNESVPRRGREAD